MTVRCKSCGGEVGESESYCPHCGERMFGDTNISSEDEKKGLTPAAQGLFSTLSMALLIVIGLPTCLAGGCLLAFSNAGGPVGASTPPAPAIGILVVGLGGLAIFGLLLWMFYRQRR